jgi:hypothetical protein
VTSPLFINRWAAAPSGIVVLIDEFIDSDPNEALASSTGSIVLLDPELPKKTGDGPKSPFLSIRSPVPSVGAKSIF